MYRHKADFSYFYSIDKESSISGRGTFIQIKLIIRYGVCFNVKRFIRIFSYVHPCNFEVWLIHVVVSIPFRADLINIFTIESTDTFVRIDIIDNITGINPLNQ